MNATVPTIPTAEQLRQSGLPVVGVAMLTFPGQNSLLALLLFHGAIRGALIRGGVPLYDSPGARTGVENLLCMFQTSALADALRAVHAAATELGVLELCQIAWNHIEEPYWRTVHPKATPLAFERFLTPEHVKAHDGKVALEAKQIEDLKRLLREGQS
jgi:hypothetical protein